MYFFHSRNRCIKECFYIVHLNPQDPEGLLCMTAPILPVLRVITSPQSRSRRSLLSPALEADRNNSTSPPWA